MKKSLSILLIAVLIILLIPIPMRLKDGGSVEFNAILYSVTKYHQIDSEADGGYVNGLEIKIFGIQVLDTRKKEAKTITITEERTKLEELEIKAEDTDITKLIRFNDTLYGKSYVMIDYAGDMSKSVGKIDFLIEKEYLPIIEGETNYEEFYEATVLECNTDSLVLNVNNVAVLFNKVERENVKCKNGKNFFE